MTSCHTKWIRQQRSFGQKYYQCSYSKKRLHRPEVSSRPSNEEIKTPVLPTGDVEKLIKKKQSPEEHPIYYATIEDTYDII